MFGTCGRVSIIWNCLIKTRCFSKLYDTSLSIIYQSNVGITGWNPTAHGIQELRGDDDCNHIALKLNNLWKNSQTKQSLFIYFLSYLLILLTTQQSSTGNKSELLSPEMVW